ncbi:MAG: hypothetical protein ABR523_03150 [Desulfurivibrionaceae bacterium]
MGQEYILKVSELQSAREGKDRQSVRERFAAAREALDKGGKVRLNKEYSDGVVETVHLIDNVAELKKLEEQYLPGE